MRGARKGRRSRQAPVAPAIRAASATTAGIPFGPGTPPSAPRRGADHGCGAGTMPGSAVAPSARRSSAPSSDPRSGIDGADTRPARPVDVHQCADAGSILESALVSAENGRRSMTRNRGAPDNSGQAIARSVERLADFFAAETRPTHKQAEDRAHIATTGDRPFAGCNPCRAATPVASMTPPCDPAAWCRHGS